MDNRIAMARFKGVTLKDLLEKHSTVHQTFRSYRLGSYKPNREKRAPSYSVNQVAGMIGRSVSYVYKRLREEAVKGDQATLPQATAGEDPKQVRFSLAEVRVWVKAFSNLTPRPSGVRGRIFMVGNLKGGVGKTFTTSILAKELALLGRSVLIVDGDPQGTLSTSMGVDISDEIDSGRSTMNELFFGENMHTPNYQRTKNLVRKTYWDGVDILPGDPSLFKVDYYVPNAVLEESLSVREATVEALVRVRMHLREVAKDYDVILIDSAPSMSMLNNSCVCAADGLLIPLPPEMLTFASFSQFMTMLAETAKWKPLITSDFKMAHSTIVDDEPLFDFIRVLPIKGDRMGRSDDLGTEKESKDRRESDASLVNDLYKQVLGDWYMSDAVIRNSEVISKATNQLGDIFDTDRRDQRKASYQHLFDAIARIGQEVNSYLEMHFDSPVAQEEDTQKIGAIKLKKASS